VQGHLVGGQLKETCMD